MKWRTTPTRRQVVLAISCWLVMPFVLVIALDHPLGVLEAALFATFGAAFLWVNLDLAFSRASATESGVELRSFLPKRRLRAPIAAIVRYETDAFGRWWIVTEERRVRVSSTEPWPLHAAMAVLAPRTLAAKRLRPHHLPPTEEFRGLWTFDTDRLLSETIGRIAILLPLSLFTHSIAGVGILVAPLIFGSFEFWTRLDVTDEGLTQRGPFHRKTILWSEAVAIYCERTGSERSFVVTDRRVGIAVPPHLAADLDTMRKVFRSLPEGTLAVNFDDSTFRGYRRKKQAKTRQEAPQEDLLPALTA